MTPVKIESATFYIFFREIRKISQKLASRETSKQNLEKSVFWIYLSTCES